MSDELLWYNPARPDLEPVQQGCWRDRLDVAQQRQILAEQRSPRRRVHRRHILHHAIISGTKTTDKTILP